MTHEHLSQIFHHRGAGGIHRPAGHGKLIFEQPVELKLDKSAKVGEIVGDELTMVGSS